VSDALDELMVVVGELRDVLARERLAIATLDVPGLQASEGDKERLAHAIHRILGGSMPREAARRAELLDQVRRVRNDLHANALLVAAAAETVRAALGYE